MKITKERIAQEVRNHKVGSYSQGGDNVVPTIWWLKRPSGTRLYHNYSLFLKGQAGFGEPPMTEKEKEDGDFDIRKELNK